MRSHLLLACLMANSTGTSLQGDALCRVAFRELVKRLTYVAPICAILLIAACSGPRSALPPPSNAENATLERLDGTGAGKIQHVVWVVQENRSFDDMFQGYPGADTVSSGKDSNGNTIQLQPVSLKTSYEIDHSAYAMFQACDGTGKIPGTKCRMDGFNREKEYGGPTNGQYAYVP